MKDPRDLKDFDDLTQEKIGMSLPNNQRRHRTVHVKRDVLRYALC